VEHTPILRLERRAGKAYFSALVVVNYLLATAIAVGIGVDAIAGEKELGSLGILRLTDLSPVSILLGKGVGPLIGLLLLLVFQIPFTLLAVTLGGVAIQQVIEAYALLASYLVALTCVGLFFSVVLAKVWRAVFMTICAGIGAALLPFYLESLADQVNPSSLPWNQQKQSVGAAEAVPSPLKIRAADQIRSAAGWIESVSPWTHSKQLTDWNHDSIALSRSLLVQAMVAVFFFALAWLLFERYCGDESRYGESRKGRPFRQRFRLCVYPALVIGRSCGRTSILVLEGGSGLRYASSRTLAWLHI
jgi:ABC-type transport system involved in multi-copper enzyme maturation permease subunit